MESEYSLKEGNIIYTNNRGEMLYEKEKLKHELKEEHKREKEFESGEKKLIKTGKSCYWCLRMEWEAEIDNSEVDHYYKCVYHDNIFCDFCAKNYHQEAIQRSEAPKCMYSLVDGKECIYEKIKIQ